MKKKICLAILIIYFIGNPTLSITNSLFNRLFKIEEKINISEKYNALHWGLACCTKSNPYEPNSQLGYTVRVLLRNMHNMRDITGGDVILNGVKKPNKSEFVLRDGKIHTLFVEKQPDYYMSYIIAVDDQFNFVYTSDNEGSHPGVIDRDTDLYVYLIHNHFDTILLAKCIGNKAPGSTGDRKGDGTVQHYDTDPPNNIWGWSYIDVAIMADGDEPTQTTVNNMEKAIDMFKQATLNKMVLSYIGKTSTPLKSGVTFFVRKSSPGHAEFLDGNTITHSQMWARADASLLTILEQLIQAAAGLRRDGGYGSLPYIGGDESNPSFFHDFNGAADLAALRLPAGFRLSTTQMEPLVGTNEVYMEDFSLEDSLIPSPLMHPKSRGHSQKVEKKGNS